MMWENVMQNKVEVREKLIRKVDRPFNVILQKKIHKNSTMFEHKKFTTV
jgi:hypothetical protein